MFKSTLDPILVDHWFAVSGAKTVRNFRLAHLDWAQIQRRCSFSANFGDLTWHIF